MSHATSQLLEQASRLSDRERGELASRLIDSLDSATDDNEVESAWDVEIQSRLADLDQGRVQPVAWTEARRLILDETQTDASDAP